MAAGCWLCPDPVPGAMLTWTAGPASWSMRDMLDGCA